MQMLVGTHFGIGIRDPEWFKHRLRLLSSVTAPSLLAQDDQNFHWVLFVDSALPATAREELEAFGMTFENGLVWIMYDMIDVKQTYDSGRIVTLGPTLRPFSFRFLSMSVFVYSQPPHHLVAMSMPHSRSEAILRNSGFEVESISTEQPVWLYCRHKQTVSGTRYSLADPVERTLAQLSRQFGLDEIKTAEYLAGSEGYGYSLVKDSMAWQMGLAKRLDRVRSEIAISSGNDAALARLRQEEATLSEQLRQLSECLTGDPDEILVAGRPRRHRGAA